ncbi:MAG TPA: HEAT repeat domain-containing protein [Gemmatimonadaceae bacterium]|nr:HEAT repeat domain-containing protein [Gemmatimonadaceae bacterium]
MPHALLYAKSLSLLLEEVETVSDLTMVRSGLLRVRRFSRSHGLTIAIVDSRLHINNIRIQRPLPGLRRLVLAMATHGIAELKLEAGAVPRELLKLAMLLVRPPSGGPDAIPVTDEIRYAALWCVQAYAVARCTAASDCLADEGDAKLERFDEVVARTDTLKQEAAAAQQASDAGRLVTVLAAIATVEEAVTHKELRVRWTAAFTECATPEALRLLVSALPNCGDLLGASLVVLRRAGDAGARILIEQLLASESMEVRRACLDALTDVRRGTDALITLLQHEQWFVVRNAATLLGAFRALEAEGELTHTLQHDDERVRAAAITSLLQLDTATARAAVRGAVRDTSPEVRRRAVRGFVDEDGAGNVEKLLQALEWETELDVQLEFLYALGALASSHAVQHLIRLCSPDGKPRPAEFRIAAAEALASARLGAAVPLLKVMLKDPDADARAAARHLIRAVS